MSLSSAELVDVKAGWNADRRRVATVILQVRWTANTGANTVGPWAVMLAQGVPLLYDTYKISGEVDDRLYCVDKQVSRPDIGKGGWKKWYVVLQYTTLNFKEQRRAKHPLDRGALVQSTHRQLTTIVERDINDDRIENSAKQPFDTPIEREDGRKIFRVTRNFSAGNGGFSFMNRINNDPYTIVGYGTAPSRTLKVNAFDEEDEREEVEEPGGTVEVKFVRRTVEMEFNPEGWQKKLYDTSTRDKNGKDILINDIAVTEPVKLDGNGNVMAQQQSDAIKLPPKDIYFLASYPSMQLFAPGRV